MFYPAVFQSSNFKHLGKHFDYFFFFSQRCLNIYFKKKATLGDIYSKQYLYVYNAEGYLLLHGAA